ncbi:hypothetical protein BEL04_07910 [Mucilaginibacter sp. PPCGB 2223]|uniref:restriction system modified-DNA reader domain-containing protein n=1 Tax=Mucilaginibacter sp. PPCGB 2223 TaxID=1886027 RepID=UPI000824BC8D|nr:DUF4357 domain-containing protein [Mucilaginibacter sp. PPCGB 2223]OCX54180.1 hypothetical protein BEL04_07910 [Mucilaginibacter sp. PPCGB 2223]
MGYIEIADVTLQMIIDAGIILPGTSVYNSVDENIVGVLNEDGSITLDINGQLKNFPYPSGAARAIVNLSVNGWIFWKIKENNLFNTLKHYKDLYLKLNPLKNKI